MRKFPVLVCDGCGAKLSAPHPQRRAGLSFSEERTLNDLIEKSRALGWTGSMSVDGAGDDRCPACQREIE